MLFLTLTCCAARLGYGMIIYVYASVCVLVWICDKAHIYGKVSFQESGFSFPLLTS